MAVTRALVLTVVACAGLAARARAETPEVTVPNPVLLAPLAHMVAMPAPPPPRVVPSHLAIGNRTFDASVNGLRAYVESIRVTEPQLYARLAPDVERLESKQAAARALVVIGLTAGVVSTFYGFAARSNCQLPSVYDPDFAAKSAAWGACTQHNLDTTAAFSFIGLGAAAAGAIGAYAVAPRRADLLEIIDQNNRQSPEPLRLEIGYDPVRKLAFTGAALAF